MTFVGNMFLIVIFDGIATPEKGLGYTNNWLHQLHCFQFLSTMVLMKGGKVCHFGQQRNVKERGLDEHPEIQVWILALSFSREQYDFGQN